MSTDADLIAQVEALRHSLREERARSARLEKTLAEAQGQQAAASEILRVISGSPSDVQPTFDSIARSARHLCEGQFCFVLRFADDRLQFGACDGLSPQGLAAFQQALPRPAGEDTAAGRAILHRAVAHIKDVRADPAYGVPDVAEAVTYRSLIAVPMLRGQEPIGAIAVARGEVGGFSDSQIALLQIFADQAAIAIENAGASAAGIWLLASVSRRATRRSARSASKAVWTTARSGRSRTLPRGSVPRPPRDRS